MRSVTTCLLFAAVLAAAGCGGNATQRAAVGGVAGAVVGGAPGAVAGGTVGAATAR
jgi:hypothetical protein